MGKKGILFGLAVIAVSMVAFLRCWDYGLVNLDDYPYITMHGSVCAWQGFASVRDFLTDVSEGIWMPLTWVSYAFDHLLFGRWYGGYHIHSIVVHFANACLVWCFLCRLLGRAGVGRSLCLIGALVWAVHPLRCESVVFLASRKDVLSFFWEILALICWVRGSDSRDRRGVVVHTVLASIFFVIGSLCKPSVMTFPVLCLLVDFLVIRRVDLRRYAFPVCYMLFLGAFAAWQQSVGGATGNFADEPLWGRVLGACAAFGIYLRNFAWPQFLAVQCVKRWPELPRFLVPGLVLSAATGGIILWSAVRYWRNRSRLSVSRTEGWLAGFSWNASPDLALAGLVWFAVAVAPMLGLADFGYHAFADRFTYIPAVGLSIILVAALQRASLRIGPVLPTAAGALAVLVLMAVTWHQTGYWSDDRRLFARTVEIDGEGNANAHFNIANWHFEFLHDLDGTIREYERAMDADFGYVVPTYHIYILALVEAGRSDEIAGRMRQLDEYCNRRFGAEEMRKLHMGLVDHRSASYLRFTFRAAKLAWLLSDRKDLPAAAELIAGTDEEDRERNPVILYLRMRYHTMKGEPQEAEKLRLRLLAENRGYFQFRFLRR